jgi:hypothetical protein
VSPGGGDFERTSRMLLAADVRQVGRAVDGQAFIRGAPLGRWKHEVAAQVGDQQRQGRDRHDANAINERRLGRVDLGDEHRLVAVVVGEEHHAEQAIGVAERAVERQLPQEEHAAGRRLELLRRDEQGNGNWKVVARALFLELRGR